jgi:hypothetical protein
MAERKIVKKRSVRIRTEPEEAEEVTEVEVVNEDEEAYEHGGEEKEEPQEEEEEEPQEEEEEEPQEEEEPEEEEEEPEEEEAEEEEAAPPRRRAKKPAKASTSGKKIAAILAVVIIVAVVLYVVVFPPATLQPAPTAKITVPNADTTDLKAGIPVTFDGTSSKSNQMSGDKKITKYEWSFGDDTTGVGATVTHTYLKKGDMTVKLTVTDTAGKSSSTSIAVTVTGAVITIPLSKYGDSITYALTGTVDIRNPNGYLVYHYAEGPPFAKIYYTVKVTQVHINIDASKNPEGTITTSSNTAEDGFAQVHTCVNRDTNQKMPFNGYAIADLTNDNTHTTTTLNQSLTGNGNVDENVCSDLNTNTTVKTTRSDQYTITIGSGVSGTSKSGTDNVIMYPKKRTEFNVNALRANRTFKSGDSGSQTFQETTLNWVVVKDDDVVGGQPTIQIHITMDSSSMSHNGFSVFDLYVWVSSAFSLPLKLQLHTEGTKNGNTVKLSYNTVVKNFKNGDTDIPFGTGLTGPFITKRTDVNYAAPDSYGPAMGPNAPSLDSYPLPNAVTYAKAHSSGLTSYLAGHSNAFLIDAYYNSSSGDVWNLTFGVKDSTSAYNIIVTPSSIKSEGGVTVSDVSKSIKDYSSALTFTGAEQVFQSRSDIKAKVYSGNKINTKTYSLGSKADFPVPKPAIPINTNIQGVPMEYYFYVASSDGTYSAGVDSETGQVLFINNHTGT